MSEVNELTHYDLREFNEAKCGLSLLDIFHCNTSIEPSQEVHSWEICNGIGQIANNVKDVASAGATRIINIGVAIRYTDQDLLNSKDNFTRLRKRAMRSNFEFINKLCLNGDRELDVNGLLSDKNLTNKKLVTQSKTETAWKDKTNEEVFKDLLDGYNDCLDATNSNIPPDTLLVSSSAYIEMATRIFNSFNGTTILEQIEAMTGVKVKRVPELNKAFNGDTDGFIYFQNNDSYVEQLVPTFFEITEPHRHYNTYDVGCFSRYGGLVIRQPKMFTFRYGI